MFSPFILISPEYTSERQKERASSEGERERGVPRACGVNSACPSGVEGGQMTHDTAQQVSIVTGMA